MTEFHCRKLAKNAVVTNTDIQTYVVRASC